MAHTPEIPCENCPLEKLATPGLSVDFLWFSNYFICFCIDFQCFFPQIPFACVWISSVFVRNSLAYVWIFNWCMHFLRFLWISCGFPCVTIVLSGFRWFCTEFLRFCMESLCFCMDSSDFVCFSFVVVCFSLMLF